jgi:hypothetical protein
MVGVHEDVTAAWERAVEQWDDNSRHEAVLAMVVQHSAFAWAAARYKERGDDPIAQARLERLRKAATAAMMATGSTRKTDEVKSPATKIAIWLTVMIAMLLVGLLFAKIVVDGRQKKAAPGRSHGVRRAPTVTTPVQRPTGARH